MQKIQVVNILADGRSGSLFIQSLFDNHPQVVMFPGVSLLGLINFWEKNKDSEIGFLIKKFIFSYPAAFDTRFDTRSGLLFLGENKNEFYEVDSSQFYCETLKILKKRKLSFAEFFEAIHLAYGICLGKRVEKIKIIMFALHLPTKAAIDFFAQEIPAAKYLLSTREPLKSWFSSLTMKKLKFRDYAYFFLSFGNGVHNFVTDTEINCLFYHDFLQDVPIMENIRVIKIEDVNADVVRTMKKMAQWLHIDYTPSLTKSTYFDKQWWGDAPMVHQADRSGFISGETKYYQKDEILIRALLRRRLDAYGYSLGNEKHAKWHLMLFALLPTKWEVDTMKNFLYPKRVLSLLKITSQEHAKSGLIFRLLVMAKNMIYLAIAFLLLMKNIYGRSQVFINYLNKVEKNQTPIYKKI